MTRTEDEKRFISVWKFCLTDVEPPVMMENKRDTRRVKTDLHCSWGLTDACPRNGKITSLSARGCFVKTTAVTTDGQTIFVNCWLPERRWVMLSGSVIYHLERIGFGMIFNDLNDEQKETISILIEHSKTGQSTASQID